MQSDVNKSRKKQWNVPQSKLKRKSGANYLLAVSTAKLGELKEDALEYVITDLEPILNQKPMPEKETLPVRCLPNESSMNSSDDPSTEKQKLSLSRLEPGTLNGKKMFTVISMTNSLPNQQNADENTIPEKHEPQITLRSIEELKKNSLETTVSSNHCTVYKKLTEYDWSDISDDETCIAE